ncbi:MAG TPA: PEP-CTERM sorting domain-containing protein [Pirellulales bacterium]|jgi:hypothetical protein
MQSKPILAVLFSTLAVVAASWAAPAAAVAGEIFVSNESNGNVGEYTTSGATINASLFFGTPGTHNTVISGSDMFMCGAGAKIGEYTTSGTTVNASVASLSFPYQMHSVAAAGGDLFVTVSNNFEFPQTGVISEYTTSGAPVNTALVAGLSNPNAIVASGLDLFVSSFFATGTIGEYTTSGGTVSASLITGLTSPVAGIALSGSDLLVVIGNTIAEYTTSGDLVNASLITNPNAISDIAVFGTDIFVTSESAGTISEYTTSGDVVNASLITGLTDPTAIVVVPEPSSLMLLSIAGTMLALAARRRRSSRERPRQ